MPIVTVANHGAADILGSLANGQRFQSINQFSFRFLYVMRKL